MKGVFPPSDSQRKGYMPVQKNSMVGEVNAVFEHIDVHELASLALALGNMDSPPGRERSVADFVENWLRKEGFETRVVSLFPERPNVIGLHPGSGEGYSLLFNAHMDTSVSEQDVLIYRDPKNPVDHQAWLDGDMIFGNGIVNDKGPMACFLVAAKAIKKAGIPLKGDLILTAVSGEIEWEPADEFQPPQHLSHEVGTRYLVTHGIIADYALVAENTQFQFGPLEAGRAVFKVTLLAGPSLYVPYIQRPYPLGQNPNAIVQASRLVEVLEQWAIEYEKKHTYKSQFGTLVPKVNIGAIRGGAPYFVAVTPELCSVYLDFRTAPGQDVLLIQEELKRIIRSLGLEGRIELLLFQRGYEARGIERLFHSLEKAHREVLKTNLEIVSGPRASMWRDTNVFNEVGIPAASYAPGAGRGGGGKIAVSIDDLLRAARVYALVAVDLCSKGKEESVAFAYPL
jgi:acetylornithine deacetylase/succinyl-diaminopimelate desuccinylase-like protein